MNRRLAAILAADVVGYSALMGADQEGTLAALRQLRSDVFGPAVAGHRGKIVKSMGDGWLVEFAAAVDAVTCAMRVQDRLVGHETIRLRVGIHLGDINHEDEDVFGDGVNLAARLEALAEPGAVVVSDAVYSALDGTLRPSFDDQGEHRLKNIDRPVHVWTRGGAAAGAARPHEAMAIIRLDIVPVATSDERPEVRELADALSNDLYTYLGQMQFTRAALTQHPSGGAYTLSPVLRAGGDRLRLEVVLAAPGGDRRWTWRYDGALAESFDWQDQTGIDAAGHVCGVILDEEERRLDARPIEALSAAEAVVLANLQLMGPNMNAARADQLFRHAQAQAPDFAPGFVDAALAHYGGISAGLPQVQALWQNDAAEWYARGRKLSRGDPRRRASLAFIGHVMEPDPERLRLEVARALRAMPFDPLLLGLVGWALVYLGEPETAEDCFRKALAFTHPSRHSAALINGPAFTALLSGRDEEAIGHARRALVIWKGWLPAWRVIAAASARLGRMDEAHAAMAIVEQHNPGDTIATLKRRSGWIENTHTRRFFEGLRLAGLPEGEP